MRNYELKYFHQFVIHINSYTLIALNWENKSLVLSNISVSSPD